MLKIKNRIKTHKYVRKNQKQKKYLKLVLSVS